MNDTVIILGAGASADSGAPLMINFLDKAEDLSLTITDQNTKDRNWSTWKILKCAINSSSSSLLRTLILWAFATLWEIIGK